MKNHFQNKAKSILLSIFFFISIIKCSSDSDFPLPTNPIEKYALPHSVIVLDISPNPIDLGTVNSAWSIREINGVGMRIDSILLLTYSPSGSLSESSKLTDDDITQLWDFTYIPKFFADVGTLQTEISGERGGNIFVNLFGHDDNLNSVTASDTLVLSP